MKGQISGFVLHKLLPRVQTLRYTAKNWIPLRVRWNCYTDPIIVTQAMGKLNREGVAIICVLHACTPPVRTRMVSIPRLASVLIVTGKQ